MGTVLLIMGILDTHNQGGPKDLEAVAVALLVLSIEISMGSSRSCPVIPVRDLGPRLFHRHGWLGRGGKGEGQGCPGDAAPEVTPGMPLPP